jgi:hypothetical protein
MPSSYNSSHQKAWILVFKSFLIVCLSDLNRSIRLLLFQIS